MGPFSMDSAMRLRPGRVQRGADRYLGRRRENRSSFDPTQSSGAFLFPRSPSIAEPAKRPGTPSRPYPILR